MTGLRLRRRLVRQLAVARMLGDTAAIAMLETRLGLVSSGAHR